MNKIDGTVTELLDNYDVDTGNPISGVVAQIQVKADSLPKFRKHRSVPVHYEPLVEAALNKLLDENVIEPISHSEWAAPIVTVLKSDKESGRTCGDFKDLRSVPIA